MVSALGKIRKLYLILLVAVVVFFSLRQVLLRKPSQFIEYVVMQESLVDTVEVSGHYKAALAKEVFSPASGVVKKLFVDNEAVVDRDQPLFFIQSTATAEQKATAYSNYMAVVSALKTARQNKQTADATMWSKRQALLNSENAVNYKDDNTTNPSTGDDYTDLEKLSIDNAYVQTQKDFDYAQQKFKEADVAIAAAEAAVADKKRAYDNTQDAEVKSSVAGRVVNLQVKIGDEVDSSGGPVLVVADLSNSVLEAEVNEAYMPRIKVGQPAHVVFDSMKDETFDGKVERIDTVGKDDKGIVTYTARITARDLPETILPNMTALVKIETLRKDEVLLVPNSAVITQDGKKYVKKLNGQMVEVEIGVRGIAKTEIVKGLIVGDRVVANPDV